jgi:hypothetical protein
MMPKHGVLSVMGMMFIGPPLHQATQHYQRGTVAHLDKYKNSRGQHANQQACIFQWYQ